MHTQGHRTVLVPTVPRRNVFLAAPAALLLLLGCPAGSITPDDDDTLAADDDVTAGDDDAATDDDDAVADDDAEDDDQADDDDHASAAADLVADLDVGSYTDTIETLAAFGDRTQGSQSYAAAEDWVIDQFTAMGYEVHRHGFTYSNAAHANLYVDKIGANFPDRMYIVSAHLDGRGGGGAADDDGSGSSLVLEAARVFSDPALFVDVTIRFVLWDCEEVGLIGSSAYVSDRAGLQGIQDPALSGEYPEPTWLGVLQSDMLLFDHGVPPTEDQSPQADIDVEYQASSTFAAASEGLAQRLAGGCSSYCADYPAEVGSAMSNTDSVPFEDHTASVSIRENQRLAEIGAGANPHWHQPTDVFETYSDRDLQLGFNATQMVVGTVADLAGAHY